MAERRQRCSLCRPWSGRTNPTSDAQRCSKIRLCNDCIEANSPSCTRCRIQTQTKTCRVTRRRQAKNDLHMDACSLYWTQRHPTVPMASLPSLRSWLSKRASTCFASSATRKAHTSKRILSRPLSRSFSAKSYESPILIVAEGTKKLANVARGT